MFFGGMICLRRKAAPNSGRRETAPASRVQAARDSGKPSPQAPADSQPYRSLFRLPSSIS